MKTVDHRYVMWFAFRVVMATVLLDGTITLIKMPITARTTLSALRM